MNHAAQGSESPPERIAGIMSQLRWLAGLSLQGFPAAAWYYELAPPFFPQLGLFVTVMGIAVVVWSHEREKRFHNLPWRSVVVIVMAITLLATYLLALRYLTVLPPQNRVGNRRQIGFYMEEWSLTPLALATIHKLAQERPPVEVNTPSQLMNIFGVWGGQGTTDEIWKFWTVMLAGALLFGFFVVGFILWAYGLGILVRHFDPSTAE
jgi:hypothetical protein